MKLFKNDMIMAVAFAFATLGTMIGSMNGIQGLVIVCKPLLMIILSLWFFYKSRRVGDRFTLMIQLGLLFSLLGDVALMFDYIDEFFFMLGLGAFLLAQLCYCIAFAHNISNTAAPFSLIPIILSVGISAYGVFFSMDLFPRVEELIKIPLAVYTGAITLMGVTAAFRFQRTYPRSFVLVLMGALLFITSDSLLATNRFMHTLDHASWSVILSYAIGQYLIVSGCLVHVLDREEIRRRAALAT